MTPDETEPHLRAVPPAEASDEALPAARSEAGTARGERKTPLWAWVAVAAVVFCAVGWYTAYQGGVALRGELEQTQAALALSEASLAAHQAHLDVVRDETAALAGRLGSLAAEADALAARAAETPAP